MTDLADRFPDNPLVTPADVLPSRPGLSVIGVLNPAAFRWEGKTWLLLRVAEGVPAGGGRLVAPILDPSVSDGMRLLEVPEGDRDLTNGDPRGFQWRGRSYLTTISHLRLASSEDGVHFRVEPAPTLEGDGGLETYGIEDCRVTLVDGRFNLAYTAVSPDGYGVGLISTVDWRHYRRHGMVLPPPNKDSTLFPEPIGGEYIMLHRPVSDQLGGKYMWIARSPDLVHWGGNECVVRPRPGTWDSARVGAGAPPVRIPEGWLEIYHGADEHDRYCLGAVLFDASDPGKVLARSRDPIMEPIAEYERRGFFGNVVFATGAMADQDDLTLYYGAADEFVCGARLSIRSILSGMG